jgi:peptide/nickel transport system permease protein
MKQGIIKRILLLMKTNPRMCFGVVTLLLFFLMATIGPLLIELNMQADYLARFRPPSAQNILGTDYAGRDTFALIVHGSRDVMIIAFSTAFFGTGLAILAGFIAGLLGGWFDRVLMAIIDIFLTIPSFPVMAIFAALFRINDPISFGLILSIWTWPTLARSLRNQVLALSGKEFVEVCFIMDLPLRHIIIRELLPNMVPFISINL